MQMGFHRHIAEIILPSALFTKPEERGVIESPQGFAIVKGYWQPHFEEDQFKEKRPAGLAVTVEFEAGEREAAEDKALEVGLKLSEIVSLYSGSPLSKPLIGKLARIGPSDGIFEQHQYFYSAEYNRLPRIEMDKPNFQTLLKWFGVENSADTYRMELAARWYGVAVGSSDPLDGYLASWIGLESIGPVIDSRFHPNGPKASCRVCKNKAGKDRDRKKAGIEHMVRLAAPEVFESHSIDDLANIRDQIAHGLAEPKDLRNVAAILLQDLILVLGVAILTAARPESAKPGSGKAALPRDYEYRPEGMFSLRSDVELTKHRPYYGEWIPVMRTFDGEYSRLDPDGRYAFGANKMGISLKVSVAAGTAPKFERDYVEFTRLGHVFAPPKVISPDTPPVRFGVWRERPVSKAWSRYKEKS